MNEDTDVVCCFCGYEPIDPGGIYSETFDAHMCVDCELVATRVLTTAAEAGRFSIRGVLFDVRPRATPETSLVKGDEERVVTAAPFSYLPPGSRAGARDR